MTKQDGRQSAVRGGTARRGVWRGMIGRCYVPTHESFQYYGARGITVCDRWRNSYDAFCLDMGPRPRGMTLDRKDNEGNYEPGNCRWATLREQGSNKSNSVSVTLGGETMVASEAARRLKVSTGKLFRLAYTKGSAQSAVDALSGAL